MRLQVLVAAGLAAAACMPNTPVGTSQDTMEISVTDDFFTPALDTIAIGLGTTIHWYLAPTDTDFHTVAFIQPPDSTIPNSPKLSAGQTFSVFFTVPGTYNYACTLHQMSGVFVAQ